MHWTLRRKVILSTTPLVALAIAFLAAASYYSGAAITPLLAPSATSWFSAGGGPGGLLPRAPGSTKACGTRPSWPATRSSSPPQDRARRRRLPSPQVPPGAVAELREPQSDLPGSGVVVADGLDGKSVGVDLRKQGDFHPQLEAASRPKTYIGDFKRSPVTGGSSA